MESAHKGKLKIFLGYAAGVGKTYQMLTEAQELKLQGVDVAIGYFEPHGRVETIAQTEGLEFVARRVYEHRGSRFEDMDTAAVIARHPQVAVVDEFAHTNVPGAERPKRWQDVMAILDAGIDVLTSLNIQHIESLNDQVWHVTGIRVRETVPDWVVQEADEVVMVDVTPRALLHRLERGVVYSHEKAQKALENFFTESNLTATRRAARGFAASSAGACARLPAPGKHPHLDHPASFDRDADSPRPARRRLFEFIVHGAVRRARRGDVRALAGRSGRRRQTLEFLPESAHSA
jgi:two-component system, OmpR family, sensor histidine kinase KdpD